MFQHYQDLIKLITKLMSDLIGKKRVRSEGSVVVNGKLILNICYKYVIVFFYNLYSISESFEFLSLFKSE